MVSLNNNGGMRQLATTSCYITPDATELVFFSSLSLLALSGMAVPGAVGEVLPQAAGSS